MQWKSMLVNLSNLAPFLAIAQLVDVRFIRTKNYYLQIFLFQKSMLLALRQSAPIHRATLIDCMASMDEIESSSQMSVQISA